ncbi:LacI family DNA-binding transcriptional regulator [Kocuria turfanensis]|uniref:LacI family transcriptional regulator n=1 Tax=Kocuria turfanensis TaxID=388357 RepID=A0A512IGL6_9MICC|nr:LacI family DNA-binding transcriptional regulator [Kocuria turfanensis]GEO96845.1 LacI family transcriptional regulator [Kocuria turfanensis]
MNTERIRPGHAGTGRSNPTLEDIATAAGVSRSTASRAINGGDRVSPQAQAAVDAAVVELGYTPNRAARSLVTRRTSSIALVIPEPDIRIMADPFFAVIITGITDALRETDVQLVLLMSRNGDDSGRVLRYLRGGHVDGAIVVSHHRDDPWTTSLPGTGLPTVFIGRPWEARPGVPYVDTDNYQGGRLAAQHLAAGGRTRVGTVAGPADMTAAADRLAGWREGLREAGLAEGTVVHADFTTVGGQEAALRLFEEAPELDGVFAASDLMALGVLEAVRRRGRSVPEDVAVVGYDNHALSATAVPPLTTVTQPMSAMAATACRILLEEIDSPGARPAPFIYPAELVVRESSGGRRLSAP